MAEITTQLIQELRSRTQAGIKDCKKALQETDGDMSQAIEWLRKRGITKAGDKADRVTAEGVVHSYIHFGSRIGVLVELNCETDFVAKREEFKELADNVAKQIAACPGVEYVSTTNIPVSIVEKEKAIEAGKDDLSNKPPAVREKIVQGRIDKRLKEISLLDQPYIKDQSITVDELIKQTISVLKENIRVRRFVRYSVGEEIAGEVPLVPIEEPANLVVASEEAPASQAEVEKAIAETEAPVGELEVTATTQEVSGEVPLVPIEEPANLVVASEEAATSQAEVEVTTQDTPVAELEATVTTQEVSVTHTEVEETIFEAKPPSQEVPTAPTDVVSDAAESAPVTEVIPQEAPSAEAPAGEPIAELEVTPQEPPAAPVDVMANDDALIDEPIAEVASPKVAPAPNSSKSKSNKKKKR